ncbi:unnamed protein product [Protopolystoma xenopodis]|uniref:Uncharacterized protein n=1 Tax=Protopolystoma xenopodis TaxID=117903 RepID=A0A448WMY9_9PLAT|nr:unnamed protein product [Protopolystoma xenopodis]
MAYVRLPVTCNQISLAYLSTQSECSIYTSSPHFDRLLVLALDYLTHRLHAVNLSLPLSSLPAFSNGRTSALRRLTSNDPPSSGTVIMQLCSSFLLLPYFLLATSLRKQLVCASLRGLFTSPGQENPLIGKLESRYKNQENFQIPAISLEP